MASPPLPGICNAGPLKNRNEDGSPRYCRQPPHPGAARCQWHGGKSPRGIRSASFKGGRHSVDLPTHMAESYRLGLIDPKLISMRDEIAYIDARVVDYQRQIRVGVPEERIIRYRRLTQQALERLRAKQYDEAQNLLEQLVDAYDEATSAEATENKITNLMEQRRRLAETERKYEVATQGMLTWSQAATFFGSLMTAIFEIVTAPEEKHALKLRFAELIGVQIPMPQLALPSIPADPITTTSDMELADEVEYIEVTDVNQ